MPSLELDPRTMFFMLFAGSLIMAVALMVANLRGAHSRAITLWAVGSVLQAVAWIVYGMHGVLPPSTSVIALGSLCGGFAFQFCAIVDFSARRIPYAIVGGCVVAGIAVHAALYAAFGQDEHWRLVLAALEAGSWEIACCAALWVLAGSQERASYRMTSAFFALTAAVSFYRAFDTVFSATPTQTLFAVNVVQTLTFTSAYVMLLGSSLGFILMTKERADTEMLRIASTDSLTGLLNRRTFEEAARKELARTARSGAAICALMCDLDRFKRINDTYGHQVGDAVLAHFARVMREGLRPFDIVGRYGGEEFIVLLPDTAIDDAVAIAERIRSTMNQSSIKAGSGALVGCTVSIGIAVATSLSTTLESMVKSADDALYRAKAAGRNCCRVAGVATAQSL